MAQQNISTSNYIGDKPGMPDAWAADVTSLKGNPGLLGQNPGNPISRQDIPGSSEVSVKEQYDFQLHGEPGFLGQDYPDYESTLHDDQYPVIPDFDIKGDTGTKNQGPQGDQLDFGSIAPVQHQFPMSPPQSTGYNGPTSPMK